MILRYSSVISQYDQRGGPGRMLTLFRILSRKLTDPESARWGVFWNVTQRDGGPLVCGAVNAKNQMGGYIGMTGLTYEPKVDRAILLFSGRTDGDAGIAISLYRTYCLSDPRADQRADPNSGYIP
jgi:hypothetical protein